MANHEPRPSEKRGGDRRSVQARAIQAARRPNLVSEIAERRQHLDQMFFNDLKKLRREHGDRAVDQALATWQQQRDAVAIIKQKQARGPRLFGK